MLQMYILIVLLIDYGNQRGDVFMRPGHRASSDLLEHHEVPV